ncbi:MAG: hypothetical protein MUE92_12125 [Chloroflexi bacterium]|nr:hypothetical protein [Chloroflexota bacterium]
MTNPFAQAYVDGLLLGPLALPCAGAFLVAILATSLGAADASQRPGSSSSTRGTTCG